MSGTPGSSEDDWPPFGPEESATGAKPILHIAIALVWRGPELLITRRPEGTHLSGLWEFPGGKRRGLETFLAAAEREVFEEVCVVCRAERMRAPIRHEYPERFVELVPVDCRYVSGEPRCAGVSGFAWVAPSELHRYPFPEANASLLEELAASGFQPEFTNRSQ